MKCRFSCYALHIVAQQSNQGASPQPYRLRGLKALPMEASDSLSHWSRSRFWSVHIMALHIIEAELSLVRADLYHIFYDEQVKRMPPIRRCMVMTEASRIAM